MKAATMPQTSQSILRSIADDFRRIVNSDGHPSNFEWQFCLHQILLFEKGLWKQVEFAELIAKTPSLEYIEGHYEYTAARISGQLTGAISSFLTIYLRKI